MPDCIPQRCIFSIGDVIDGRFRVQKKLGEGTFGTVYKVISADNSTLALKLLKLWEIDPRDRQILVQRFDMEFQTGRIKSRHLVHSYSYGQTAGNPYIVMEYCANGDLRNYASSFTVDYITVAQHILRGLHDLHACGKVHRDLKPENVLLREDNTAVLTDFGISGDQNKRMTERGWLGQPQQLFGTYPYMPPEQVNPPRGGQATVLPTTDIFSFGVMMYEMLVGELPFGPLTSDSALPRYVENGKNGIWNRTLLQRADKHNCWLPIIEGCLQPNFKERFQTTDHVMQLLPIAKNLPRQNAPYDSILTVRRGVLLRVMQGEEHGKEYKLNELLRDRSLLTMGRNDDAVLNGIGIRESNSSYISRHHCTLEIDRKSGQWYIRDGQWTQITNGTVIRGSGAVGVDTVPGSRDYRWKQSLNGTYVNSTEVSCNGMPIKPGDIISIGDVKLRVEGY